jgi:hypothetical protein
MDWALCERAHSERALCEGGDGHRKHCVRLRLSTDLLKSAESVGSTDNPVSQVHVSPQILLTAETQYSTPAVHPAEGAE